jgi:hypothetical protein
MIESWIFKQNLESFLAMLAYIAGNPFEDWDFHAVVAGIKSTDCEKERWFEYEFNGPKRRITFRAADDLGSSLFLFRIDTTDDAKELIDLAFYICESNELAPRNFIGK